MRRYGVVFYFGLTCISMLIVSDQMHRRLRRDRIERRLASALVALCALLPLLGLAHALVPLWWPDPALKDVLENNTEWWAGAIFTAFFFGLAWGWRSTGFTLELASRRRWRARASTCSLARVAGYCRAACAARNHRLRRDRRRCSVRAG
jgi:hypothetical protein